jgi:hypothetical protein
MSERCRTLITPVILRRPIVWLRMVAGDCWYISVTNKGFKKLGVDVNEFAGIPFRDSGNRIGI